MAASSRGSAERALAYRNAACGTLVSFVTIPAEIASTSATLSPQKCGMIDTGRVGRLSAE
jgi:hypothetical protein